MQNQFAVISAFRGGSKERKQNLIRTSSLIGAVMALGLGGLRMVGHWIENKGTPEESSVEEISFLIPNKTLPEHEFYKEMIALGKRFEQEAIIIGNDRGVFLLSMDGTAPIRLGDSNFVKMNDLGEVYSTVNNKSFQFGRRS